MWLDGRLVPWDSATVHVRALGTAAAASCFEGIRGYWNPLQEQLHIFRLHDHLVRLQQSMKILRMGLTYTLEELAQATVDLVRACRWRENIYIRVLAFYGADAPGEFVWDHPASILITAAPRRSRLGSGTGIHCAVSSWTRISDAMMPPRVKAVANYLNSRYADVQARVDGYDGAILLDASGKVTEGAGACIFIVRGEQPITTPVTGSILESITRRTVLHLLRTVLDRAPEERAVDRTELYVADEVFWCGTGGGEITPILSVDRYQVGNGRIGSLTETLERLYHDIVTGRSESFAAWLTTV